MRSMLGSVYRFVPSLWKKIRSSKIGTGKSNEFKKTKFPILRLHKNEEPNIRKENAATAVCKAARDKNLQT